MSRTRGYSFHIPGESFFSIIIHGLALFFEQIRGISVRFTLRLRGFSAYGGIERSGKSEEGAVLLPIAREIKRSVL